jgi:hypothetical protein
MKIRKIALSGMVTALVLGIAAVGFASDQNVQVQASIAQQLVFSVSSGDNILLSVDPVSTPSAEGSSVFAVSTNVDSYAISAAFGAFEVGSSGYDLIAEGNFKLKSTPSGIGTGISAYASPTASTDILTGEDGLTNSESMQVDYQLAVDFTVPNGSASITIVYTASLAL